MKRRLLALALALAALGAVAGVAVAEQSQNVPTVVAGSTWA